MVVLSFMYWLYHVCFIVYFIAFYLLQAIDAKYTEVAAGVGPDQEVMFEEEQITLDIPEEGLVLESGWTITPHTYPGVSLCEYTTTYYAKTFSMCALLFPTDH